MQEVQWPGTMLGADYGASWLSSGDSRGHPARPDRPTRILIRVQYEGKRCADDGGISAAGNAISRVYLQPTCDGVAYTHCLPPTGGPVQGGKAHGTLLHQVEVRVRFDCARGSSLT